MRSENEMKLNKEKIGHGDCFESNTKIFLDIHSEFLFDAYLCHGYVRGSKGSPVEGFVFVHCWIEIGDCFYDYSNGRNLCIRKDIVYKEGEIIKNSVIRYTIDEVREMTLKHKFYGSWDKTFEQQVLSEEEAKK